MLSRTIILAGLIPSVCLAPAARAELTFTALGDLPGGEFASIPLDISDGGDVVVGGSISATGREAFRWTRAGGMVGLGDLAGGDQGSIAAGVSGDGEIVVGIANDHDGGASIGNLNLGLGLNSDPDGLGIVLGGSTSYPTRAERGFRWTAQTGMVALTPLPRGNQSVAYDTSDDGASIAGVSDNGFPARTVRWDNGEISFEPGTEFNTAYARACDATGDLVIGTVFSRALNSLVSAFATSGGNGAFLVSPVEGGPTFSADCSRDGKFAAGIGGISQNGNVITSAAMIWPIPQDLATPQTVEGIIIGANLPGVVGDTGLSDVSDGRRVAVGIGERASGGGAFIAIGGSDDAFWLDEFLLERGMSLPGWTLSGLYAVSRDGNAIAGAGINPQGFTEAFVITGLAAKLESPANSSLRISAPGGLVQLNWLSSSAERYRVQRYQTATRSWLPISPFLDGTGGEMEISQARGTDRDFYRLEISLK